MPKEESKKKFILYQYKTKHVITECSAGRRRAPLRHRLWRMIYNVNRSKNYNTSHCGGKKECEKRKKKLEGGKLSYVQHWDYVDFKRVRRSSI